MDSNITAAIIGLVAGIIGGGFGVYFALYAMGFFQYLGGKKPSDITPVSKEELARRLAALNDPARPYHIIKGEDTDLIAEWKIVDASWYGIFSKSHLSQAYRAYLLLDDTRYTVRYFEELGTVSWTAGASGLRPNVHYQKTFFRGRVLYHKEFGKGYGIKEPTRLTPEKVYDYKFDINDIRQPVVTVVKESGWEWVPVTAKRHATYQHK